MSIYHTKAALDEWTRERLDAMLAGDEQFLLAVTVSDGLYKRHRSRLVLTDAHLFRLKRGYGVYTETERYALADLSDLSLTVAGRAKLELVGPDGPLSYPLEPDHATEFAAAVERGVARHSMDS